MALHLSQEDQQLFEELKKFGVLQHVDGHRLDQSQGVFIVMCSDGDQSPDIITFHSNLMNQQRDVPRLHLFADHGLALCLAPDSPLSRNYRGQNLFESIGDVPTLKGIKTGALYIHAPCAAATRAELNLLEQIRLVKAGKALILKQFPGLQIACFLHIDNGGKHSYFIEGSLWREWLKRQSSLPVL